MKTIAKDLSFPEGPRWRDGYFYFSDFYRKSVFRIGESEKLETVAKVPEQPSGLGWLPDSRLLIVSMVDRRLLIQEKDGSMTEHADLSDLAPWHCNDIVVDSKGRAYVGNFGFDTHADGPPQTTDLIFVDTSGYAKVAAPEMAFPNGTVITPDGKTLIIGETYANRLTAFDIAEDGSLSNRRVWANITPHWPDGICLDAEGMIWVADPPGKCIIRVKEGGEIVQKVDVETRAFACALGSEDRKTLYVCTAESSGPKAKTTRTGRIETTRVDVPGTGWP